MEAKAEWRPGRRPRPGCAAATRRDAVPPTASVARPRGAECTRPRRRHARGPAAPGPAAQELAAPSLVLSFATKQSCLFSTNKCEKNMYNCGFYSLIYKLYVLPDIHILY